MPDLFLANGGWATRTGESIRYTLLLFITEYERESLEHKLHYVFNKSLIDLVELHEQAALVRYISLFLFFFILLSQSYQIVKDCSREKFTKNS